ncbi:uncharacterized protein [Watersipora subatra]|uniref:uncharacterized protein n=1 Tax=Watersipora subatra TaxID=2589382 RepID=UPI00355BE2CD
MNIERMEAEVLREKLGEHQLKLARTISQLQLVENKLRDLQQRSQRASANKQPAYEYHLRMKHSITGNIKIAYQQYVTKKAVEVRQMEEALVTLLQRQQENEQAAQEMPAEPAVAVARREGNM